MASTNDSHQYPVAPLLLLSSTVTKFPMEIQSPVPSMNCTHISSRSRAFLPVFSQFLLLFDCLWRELRAVLHGCGREQQHLLRRSEGQVPEDLLQRSPQLRGPRGSYLVLVLVSFLWTTTSFSSLEMLRSKVR